jgi:hypothetical protein
MTNMVMLVIECFHLYEHGQVGTCPYGWQTRAFFFLPFVLIVPFVVYFLLPARTIQRRLLQA